MGPVCVCVYVCLCVCVFVCVCVHARMSLSMRVSNHLRGLTNLLYDNTLICYYSESRIYTHTCAHTISVHLCVGLCVLFAGILFISALCLCVQRLLVA